MSRNILLTGATGFVGGAIAKKLVIEDRYALSVVSRRASDLKSYDKVHLVPNIDSSTDWTEALVCCDVVVHGAARVHVMNEDAGDPLNAFREVNVGGTLAFARQAVAAGVKRFIFISSIKVNGEGTPLGKPYNASDAPIPEDAYGQSKLEAEQGLVQLSIETGLEVVIIRPPLVYGPGVKGNFASMIKLVEKGLPLPLGATHNKRSMVGIDNLVDLIIRCIDHPAAANQVFLAGDGEDLSTTELLQGVCRAMGKPARLVPLPTNLLLFGARLLGKKAIANRLLGSLQVDISKTRELLSWKPPYTVEEGLRHCFTTRKD